MTLPRRAVILGAAGRDFHDFNVAYRDDPGVQVVAFTAAQIPGIAGRRYPAALAGPRYPAGIPIVDEAALPDLCRRERVTEVVFAYSDVPHAHVMRLASQALAAGADFVLPGPTRADEPARRRHPARAGASCSRSRRPPNAIVFGSSLVPLR